MGRLAYKSAMGFSAVTSVECIYSRFPSWKPEEYVGSVKGGWGGEQTRNSDKRKLLMQVNAFS